MFVFLVLVNFIFYVSAADTNDLKLELVQIVFRHGDRTPDRVDLCTNDPNRNSSSYRPYGRITQIGKERSFDFGKLLKSEYESLLSKDYQENEIYVRSSDMNRTQMSTEYVLSGLYPDKINKDWAKEIDGSLIFYDNLFHSSYSPRFYVQLNSVRRLPEVKQMLAKYDNFKRNISRAAGIRSRGILHLNYLIEAQVSMNLTAPSWRTENVTKTLRELYEIERDIESYNDKLKQLTAGPMIQQFFKNIQKNEKKMFLYGGHDYNLAHLERALGIKEYLGFPSYLSAIILEKYQDSEKQEFIKVRTYDGNAMEFREAKLKDCDIYCPFEEFKKILAPVTPTKNVFF